MRNIAIIPARSGSKGLIDKNIKELAGKPLMAYTIEAAIDSKMFDTVMISTDSEKYAEIARKYGAEVPFLRSDNNSSDKASSWDTVLEVLDKYEELGEKFDTFMLLQPTSPLRSALDIKKSYSEFENKQANAIVSVCEVDHSPLYSNVLPESLSMDNFISSMAKNTRRQDIEIYYRLNGAIYLAEIEYFRKYMDIFKEKCFAYVMDKRESIDIDDNYDFAIAKAMLNMITYN